MVLAKVNGSFYPDLTNAGYTSGHVIKCPKCDEEYRVFYEQKPGNVTEQSAGVPKLEDAVENSHPKHPDRVRVV